MFEILIVIILRRKKTFNIPFKLGAGGKLPRLVNAVQYVNMAQTCSPLLSTWLSEGTLQQQLKR